MDLNTRFSLVILGIIGSLELISFVFLVCLESMFGIYGLVESISRNVIGLIGRGSVENSPEVRDCIPDYSLAHTFP